MASWVDQELAGCDFADARLGKRFKRFVEQLSEGIVETIPMACQDWANTKAAYRFFSNERVSENDILAGHFQATRERFATAEGSLLVLQDTSAFSYQKRKPDLIGFTRRVKTPNGRYGEPETRTICGILMHSSLAVT